MQEVIDKINNAEKIAVFPHINEDPDALGSCFAFCRVMRDLGKKAVCLVNDKPQEHFAFISTDYEIYAGDKNYDFDLCAALDCGDLERLGNRRELFDKVGNSVNIDHHKTNTLFADANYVEPQASSTGEILYGLFSKMGIKLSDAEARLLYIAICSDTGCFKYSNVSPKTFRCAAELIGYGFDFAEEARLLFDTEPLNVTRFKAAVTLRIERFLDGRLSVVEIDDNMYEEYGVPYEEAPNIVDIPRRVENTEIAIAFKHKKEGIGVNLRSNGDADVAAIAIKFGGGGHTKAAGCTVKCDDMQKVRAEVIAKCEEAIRNL